MNFSTVYKDASWVWLTGQLLQLGCTTDSTTHEQLNFVYMRSCFVCSISRNFTSLLSPIMTVYAPILSYLIIRLRIGRLPLLHGQNFGSKPIFSPVRFKFLIILLLSVFRFLFRLCFLFRYNNMHSWRNIPKVSHVPCIQWIYPSNCGSQTEESYVNYLRSLRRCEASWLFGLVFMVGGNAGNILMIFYLLNSIFHAVNPMQPYLYFCLRIYDIPIF